MRLPSTSPISDRYRRRDRLYLVKIRYGLYLSKFYFMETATILGVSIAAALVGITALALYTAFGPPAAELSDPFEDHED
jgi:PsbN protein